MSSAAKEKKRAADRETQRLNRARTKAYIKQLERTVQDLTGPNPQSSLDRNLAEQQKKISDLQDALRRIGILAQDATNALPSSSVPDHPLALPLEASQVATENEQSKSGIVDLIGAKTSYAFYGIDLTCSDRERNYLAVLGSAVTVIQDYYLDTSGGVMLTPELNDDNFCIRAIVDGWKVTTDLFGSDVIWGLIQAIDEGLYYRADPVTRIALLRIMRSVLLRLGVFYQTSSVPQYMLASPLQTSITHQPFLDFFPWPETRDQWIVKGTEYANELCAASFSARIWFQWPFELRDVFRKQVLTGKLSFSTEFESYYHELSNWRLEAEGT